MERKEVKWLESKQESPPRVLPPLDLGGRVTAATGGRLSLSLPACKSAVPVAIFYCKVDCSSFFLSLGENNCAERETTCNGEESACSAILDFLPLRGIEGVRRDPFERAGLLMPPVCRDTHTHARARHEGEPGSESARWKKFQFFA